MRTLALFISTVVVLVVSAQNTIAFQGFESPATCPDWGYVGGVVNTEAARTGTRSARVGRAAESNMITFNTQTITGYANVVLSLFHLVRPAPGPGMDTNEGAQIEVQLNGGAWIMIGRVSGFGDFSWSWLVPGGNPGSGCTYTCANGLFYNVPGGTSTIAVRVFSQFGSGCPKPLGNYDRSDEGFFIDDVRLTTTSTIISSGTGTITWTGAVNTDWFLCSNWSPTIVPGPGHDVVIDQTSINNCVIGVNITTPLNAFAATLIVRTNNATSRTLTLNNARTIVVGGQVTVQRTVAGGQHGITVQNGSFTSGGLSLLGTAGGTFQSLFRNNVATNTVQFNGNVSIGLGGILDIQGAPGGTIGVAGDLSNNDLATAFPKAGSLVIMNGTTGQVMNSITATGEPYASLRVSKGSGDITLNAPIRVSNTLEFVQGRVFSTAVDLVILLSGSGVSGVSDASFVHGPVRKIGNTNFTFPVGKGSFYRPIAISNPGGNAALYFTGEFFLGDPTSTFGVPREPTLDHVSHCEWWILDRSAAQTPLVTLSWGVTSCGVTDPLDLVVAEWYSGQWRDRGNGGTMGTLASGTVITSGPQSLFNVPTPWTLASTSNENPLPIELLSFTAAAIEGAVRTEWVTATERDNESFHVERSTDGATFVPIHEQPGAGNSSSELYYGWVDPDPVPGLSFYRLRQTDFDGATSLSHVVPVQFTSSVREIIVHSNADGLVVWHDLGTGGQFHLFDALGHLIASGNITEANRMSLPTYTLVQGVYLLRLTAGDRQRTAKFFHSAGQQNDSE